MAAAAAVPGPGPGPGPGPAEAAAPGEEAAGAAPQGLGPARLARLPLARVKALVKADPDVTLASQEAVFVLARATELFVETIAKDAYVYAQQGKRKTLQRKDLDNAIEAIDEFAFLEGEFVHDFSILCINLLRRERTESFAKLSVSISSVIPSAPLSTGMAQLDPEARAVVVGTCPEGWLWLLALKTFPDSPWEVTINVGKCSDPTYNGLFCVPTKFSTALVKNPRGGERVQTLENWEMKEKGYCVSQVEYYEIVRSSAGRREEGLKEIDVGRCLGSCSSGDPCLLRLRFRSRRNQVHTVAAIREYRGERGWKLRVGLLETPPDCLWDM
ncbi:unnamed protein product [Coccothraustes coccothraustes]